MDKRSKNTQDKLHNVLIDLFTTNTYKEISINDICEKAGIKRPTFYNHYENKEDFVEKALYDHFTRIIQKSNITDKVSFRTFFLTLLEGYLKDLSLYKDRIKSLNERNDAKDLTFILYKTCYKIFNEKLTSLYPYEFNKSLLETFIDTYVGVFIMTTTKFLIKEDYDLDTLMKNLKKMFTFTSIEKDFKNKETPKK